jgi:hypothetical protein
MKENASDFSSAWDKSKTAKKTLFHLQNITLYVKLLHQNTLERRLYFEEDFHFFNAACAAAYGMYKTNRRIR